MLTAKAWKFPRTKSDTFKIFSINNFFPCLVNVSPTRAWTESRDMTARGLAFGKDDTGHDLYVRVLWEAQQAYESVKNVYMPIIKVRITI